MRPISRRTAVVTGGAVMAAATGVGLKVMARPPALPGTLDGANSTRGHRLRNMDFPPPSAERQAQVVVVGGGVAGLSAAWTLQEAGVDDVVLLELEDSCGGNARSGRNAVSAYPLGAHYLPIPNREAVGVRRLLERLGVITGWEGGKPIFDEYQVLSDSDERLLHLGRWEEGLVPSAGLTDPDRRDFAAFFAEMERLRHLRGADGRPAFAVPMALSSRDPALLALDQQDFRSWVISQGWRSPALHAHLRYCCRDDYGAEPHEVSAWAGAHYFASRRGEAANVNGDTVLTWPEGNGRLVAELSRRLGGKLNAGHVVHRVRTTAGAAEIDTYDVAQARTVRWRAPAAVIAAPRFVASRLCEALPQDGFTYAPWVVANVTVDRPPAGRGAQLAWDNVSWTSNSLGYVVATHQDLGLAPGPTVLTWYLPLSDMAPADARQLMLARSLGDWQTSILDDLLAMNPDLKGAVRRIDVWRWGHAMIRPTPGFMWGGAREAAAAPRPPLFFAHSDLSGLSIFEEAHYRGVDAAEAAMTHLALPYLSQLRDEAA